MNQHEREETRSFLHKELNGVALRVLQSLADQPRPQWCPPSTWEHEMQKTLSNAAEKLNGVHASIDAWVDGLDEPRH